MTRYILILFSSFYFSTSFIAQEQIALRTGNHAGILGAQLNPALLSSTDSNWDFNIISGGLHLRNNYGFLENTSLLKLGMKRPEFILREDVIDEPANGAQIIDFYDEGKMHHVKANEFIQGLSGFVRLKKISLGISIRDRIHGFAEDISKNLGYYAYQRLTLDSTINLTSSNVATMRWTEVNAHIAFATSEDKTSKISVGINPKLLFGHFAAYGQINGNPQISRQANNQIQVENGQLEMGLSDGGDQSSFGMGLDLGINLLQQVGTRRVIAGISLLDVGGIKYNRNTRKTVIDFENFSLIRQDSSLSFDDFNGRFDEIEAGASNNNIQQSDHFFMHLPTALSMQIDIQVSKKWFVNGMLIQRINLAPNQVRRSNLLAISPRFETQWLSFYLPVSIADYEDIQIGLASRIGPLTLGSEEIKNIFLKQKRLDAADFYVSLSLNNLLFKNKGNQVKCWNHGSNGIKKKF